MTDELSLSQKNLKKIFNPQSVAILGANKVSGTVPNDIVQNMLKADFQGVIYPVSPREKFISGLKAFKYVVDIEDPIDLAVLVFPSSVCHMALDQCGQKGIKSVIIISAGFREVGGTGIEREETIKEIAKKYDMSFIGPNCLGVINTDPTVLLNASFARKMPEAGSIGFISQSGALCTAVLDYAQAKHIGFSKFISFGNKSDISEIDLLYYLGDDPKTKVILVYLEEISDGPGLMKVAKEVISSTGKPILAIKSGRTSEGARAAASHTGSLAGRDEITEAALAQAGIIRCTDIEEMFNKAIALAYQPLPVNNRVAIITNAGGPGVLTTDASIAHGLKLAKFSEETTKAFKKSLPNTANIKNPVDVIGDARVDRYNVAVSKALNDSNVDGVFVILTPQSMTDIDAIAREICKVSAHYKKPLYTSFMGEADVASGIDILQRNKIPHYQLAESMSMAYAAAYNFKIQLDKKSEKIEIFNDVKKKEAQSIISKALKEERKYLPEIEASQVLAAYGLPVVANGLATNQEEAVRLANKIGYPVVMKVVSEEIIHKFDVKGVILNLTSDSQVEDAYNQIINNASKLVPDAKIQGIMVGQMIPSGEEVILGVKRDDSFGSVLMFGLGGIFVELFKDVSFRVAPLDRLGARAMIDETKAAALLTGYRGKDAGDIPSIVESLQRISQLAIDCPQIKELDINPLIVQSMGKGCLIADTKIML